MYIGIDLGGTNIAVGVVDETGRILKTDSTPTNKERGYTDIVADMAALAKKVIADAGLAETDIKGVGIGCPGSVDSKNGIVVYANNLKMEHTPVAAEFKRHWDLPVTLINDADAAAHIPDFHHLVSYSRIGDRYYAIVAQRNRYYGNSIEDYDGENVFLVTVDAVTEKVIYLQKYHIENYWGYEYRLFTLGEDGILYDPMIP